MQPKYPACPSVITQDLSNGGKLAVDHLQFKIVPRSWILQSNLILVRLAGARAFSQMLSRVWSWRYGF